MNQSPIKTVSSFGKIFMCNPLTAVMREDELISKIMHQP